MNNTLIMFLKLNMSQPFYLYVDVDEVFVKNYGSKRIPMSTVKELWVN
jgi:hypothetical protein